MKISRTSSPHQPGSPGKTPGVGGASGKGFAAKLGAAKADGVSKGTAATVKSTKARKALSVSDIGAALKAGKLTPQAAIDKVIERVLDRQVGRKAGIEVRQKIGTALRESLADDPFLASKIRALGQEE
jgi:hypothetical protein